MFHTIMEMPSLDWSARQPKPKMKIVGHSQQDHFVRGSNRFHTVTITHMEQIIPGKTYKPNGKRECARRVRQAKKIMLRKVWQ